MRSIRTKLSTLVIMAVIVSVFTLGIISVYYIRMSANDYSDELLNISCANTQQRIDTYFEGIEQCVETVAYSTEEGLAGLRDDQLHKYLDEAKLLFHSVVGHTNGVITYYYRIDPAVSNNEKGFWFVNDKKGRFEETELTDITAYDSNDTEHVGWFYIPRNKGKATWLEPYINRNLDNTKMISYVSPVFWNGQFIGVVGIDYDFNTLTKHMEYSGTFKNAFTLLVDSEGKAIFSPEDENKEDIDKLAATLQDYRDDFSILHVQKGNEPMRASKRILSNGMMLYLLVPEEDINAVWKQMLPYYAFFALLIAFLFIMVTSYMAGRMTKPLAKLTEAAKRIDAGDYDVELNYDGHDEIGVLAGVFRQLVKHLSSYITDLNDKAYKDALTMVRNKAAFIVFMKELDDRIKTAKKDEKPEFAICMFDCNDLKGINDTYGHDKGDIFIRNACSLICDVFKHSPVFRLGGDEFICVLEGESLADRENLCAEFEARSAEINKDVENPWDRINIASGIAIYDHESDTDSADVLKRADKRMYEDKDRKKSGE